MMESLPLLATLAASSLFGSWHCAAMCGPIALAMSQRQALWPYHLGRGLSYTAAGLAAGGLGKSLLTAPSPALRYSAFAALALMLTIQLLPTSWSAPLLEKLPRPRRFLQRTGLFHPSRSAFAFGFFSLLLPCAWLWTFLAAAAASGSALSGGLVLFILWASSLPALSAMSLYFRRAVHAPSSAITRWVPWGIRVASLYALCSHFLMHA